MIARYISSMEAILLTSATYVQQCLALHRDLLPSSTAEPALTWPGNSVFGNPVIPPLPGACTSTHKQNSFDTSPVHLAGFCNNTAAELSALHVTAVTVLLCREAGTPGPQVSIPISCHWFCDIVSTKSTSPCGVLVESLEIYCHPRGRLVHQNGPRYDGMVESGSQCVTCKALYKSPSMPLPFSCLILEIASPSNIPSKMLTSTHDRRSDRILADEGRDDKHVTEYLDELDNKPQPGSQPPPLVAAMNSADRERLEKKLRRKIDFRLLPPVIIMYILNYLDRARRPLFD